jgi:CheY-like chemotaxis protein
MGARVRLEQIVWNLIANSVKFTPVGGWVVVSITDSPAEASITVDDNGIGISEDFLPFVFDTFRQGEGFPARKHEGLGLGLSIVRAFVEAHKGRVWAKSEGRGKGAAFTVVLPKVVEVASERGGVPGVLLLLSNKCADLEPLLQGLRAAGCRIHTAQNVSDAVEFLKSNQPQATIVDMGISETEAIGMLTEARDIMHVEVPLIALSASLRDADRRRLLDLGFTELVPVTTSAEDLLETIRQAGLARTSTARPA